MSESSLIHVAVGVLRNADGEVLVTRRHEHLHQGGLLEFPGGKLETGEDRFAGLQREFREELGLHITAAVPLKKISHHYVDKSVQLDVWLITEFSGVAQGLEGQPLYWIHVDDLSAGEFPAANKHIVEILQLPAELAITPDVKHWSELERYLDHAMDQGAQLIQLRQKAVSATAYQQWYDSARDFCSARGVRVMYSQADLPGVDGGPGEATGIDGLHCTSATLMSLRKRPVPEGILFAASCHNLEELLQAENLGADYVTLSPVMSTPKYGESQLLGWEGFSALRQQVSLPVFALGGLSRAELDQARLAGAQGIAGIRLFSPVD